MAEIRAVPLGAGQDVGRSCILLTMGGKNIMLDCGMHMGFQDERRFPDFSFITNNKTLTEFFDCVILSHFHLDHCGALPYMSEMVGYDGPIYMTHPTKAICPILLEDFRKVQVERKGDKNMFTSEMIKQCMKKVKAVNLHQVVRVDDDLEIKAYYAGHVLGAAMFLIRCGGGESVVYTGDYNMTPDRHLGAAWIDACRPDLLITESTYATTIRDSKRCRERDFLKKIHTCIEKGGKVLIPVFALGRAQELCILLETYWERMNLSVPVYFSAGLAEKATNYYKLFITWTSEKIKKTFVQRNMFDFKHIKPLEKSFIDHPGPMVVFATPGMLHGGLSLLIFKRWAEDERNMLIMPGYCVSGTVGSKVIGGQKRFEFENRAVIELKMSVQYMSFSAHADAKGIMQLIRDSRPREVMLVHGEAKKMEFLREKVLAEFRVPCHKPANGEAVVVRARPRVDMGCGKRLWVALQGPPPQPHGGEQPHGGDKRCRMFEGCLVGDNKSGRLELVDEEGVMARLEERAHTIKFSTTVTLEGDRDPPTVTTDRLLQLVRRRLLSAGSEWCDRSVQKMSDLSISVGDGGVIMTVNVGPPPDDTKVVLVSWQDKDEELGSAVLKVLQSLVKT